MGGKDSGEPTTVQHAYRPQRERGNGRVLSGYLGKLGVNRPKKRGEAAADSGKPDSAVFLLDDPPLSASSGRGAECSTGFSPSVYVFPYLDVCQCIAGNTSVECGGDSACAGIINYSL